MKILNYKILLKKEPEGGFTVFTPSLPGCITYGDTLDEGIIASGIVCFMLSIGEFIFALTICTNQTAHTLPVELTLFLSKHGIEYGKITAAAILTLMIPVLLVLIFQKYLVEGLTKGAVKE